MTRYLVIPALVFATLGCGDGTPKPPDLGGEDGRLVATVVEDLNDALGNAKKLAVLHSGPLRAEDAKKYGSYSFSVTGKPSVSGTTATCLVRIDKADGTKAGEKEWSFVKEGDKWKIKTAPLP